MSRGIILMSLLGVIFSFQNCSKANFNTSAKSLAYQSCTEQLAASVNPIKVVFIVDTSGSNAGNDGSDPNKTVRGGSITEFFDTYKAKTNFAYSFLHFSGSKAYNLIGSSASPVFSANPADMQSAINSFYGISDSGLTPYNAALNMGKDAITNDGANFNALSKYVVVFISDGLPDPVVDDATLKAKVQAIVGVHPGHISFNAIYYGDPDPVANNRLKMMAQAGGGQFLDANATAAGKQFVISDVINVAGLNCGSAN